MSEQAVPDYLLLRSANARKVGQRTIGKIRYDVLCNTDRSTVFICITGNESGGYFSSEKVDFDKVAECVAGFDSGRTLPSKVFGAAFVGRSSNNAGFLAAVLRAERLLDAAPGTDFQHVVSGDWSAWKAATLTLESTVLVEPVVAAFAKAVSTLSTKASENAPEHKEHTKGAKNRKDHAPTKRQ